MKTKAVLILIVLVTASSTINISFVKGDIVDYGNGFTIKPPYFTSPTNTTYNSGFLTLNVTFPALIDTNIFYSMNYSLDGSKNVTVPLASHYFGFFLQNESYIDSLLHLPKLNAGAHHISVYLEYIHRDLASSEDIASGVNSSRISHDSQTVYFTVLGTSPTPSPTIPEFPSWTILPLLITVFLLGTWAYRRKLKAPTGNPK